LPIPEKGWEVEEVLVSPEAIVGFLNSLKVASNAVIAVTTLPEQISLYQGTASDETLTVAHKCLKLRDPAFASLFKNKYEFADMFSAMGRMVKPEFLEYATASTKSPPPDLCHIDDGSEARILRQSLLAEKDPALTQDEMNTIIDKELEHNTDKIRMLRDLLQSIMNGTAAPSFPPLFGRSDALIPELPPAMKRIAGVAIQGPLSYIMNNFNQEVVLYPNICESYYNEPNNQNNDIDTNQNIPSIIFTDLEITTDNPDGNLVQEADSPRKVISFTLGYDINSLRVQGVVSEEFTENFGSPYSFPKNPDVAGTPLDSTPGFFGFDPDIDDGSPYGQLFAHSYNKNDSPDEQAEFQRLARDIGYEALENPYVRRNARNKDKMIPWDETTMVLSYGGDGADFGDLGQNLGSLNPSQRWWWPMLIMNNINAAANDLTDEDDPVQEFTFKVDPDLNENVTWRLEVLRTAAKRIEATIKRTVKDNATATEVSRKPDAFENIVRLTIHRNGHEIVDYYEPEYTISFEPRFLGRKITQSDLEKTRFSTAAAVFQFDSTLDNYSILPVYTPSMADTNRHGIRQSLFNNLSSLQSSRDGRESMGDILTWIIKQFTTRIKNSQYFDNLPPSAAIIDSQGGYESVYDNLNLLYPNNDILGYEQFKNVGSNLAETLLSLAIEANSQTSTGKEVYCDTLSPSRRSAAIVSTMFLIRLFIVEQALISIHVFDSFDLLFMDSDTFISTILQSMLKEMDQYTHSFDLAQSEENDIGLRTIIGDCAVKYYEVQNLTGASDAIFDPDRPASALKALIKEEIAAIRPAMIGANFLDHGSSGAKSWDEYLIDDLIGTVSQSDNSMFVSDIWNLQVVPGAWTERPILTFKEAFYQSQYDWATSTYSTPYYSLALWARMIGQDGRISNGEKLFEVTCEQSGDPYTAEQEAKVLKNLKHEMLQSPEYNELFHSLLPIADIIASLSLYEYAALADNAVFKGTYNGINLHDMFAKTKVAILQSIASAIYGQGKIDYEDPFLKKAGIS